MFCFKIFLAFNVKTEKVDGRISDGKLVVARF